MARPWALDLDLGVALDLDRSRERLDGGQREPVAGIADDAGMIGRPDWRGRVRPSHAIHVGLFAEVRGGIASVIGSTRRRTSRDRPAPALRRACRSRSATPWGVCRRSFCPCCAALVTPRPINEQPARDLAISMTYSTEFRLVAHSRPPLDLQTRLHQKGRSLESENGSQIFINQKDSLV
jgi:hypothetical protein